MSGTFIRGMFGTVQGEILGAYPEECLSALSTHNVQFWNFHKVDDLTIRLTVSIWDKPKVSQCAGRCQCTVQWTGERGIVPTLRGMGRRCGYFAVLLAAVFAVFWLQGHLMFFTVSGNETIPQERILQVLEECGVGFWTKSDSLDMNLLKNQVLSALPELSWITINTQGSLAQVIVRERTEEPVTAREAAPANIVAKKSGLITEISVTGGTAQVQPGDVVTAGQLLISGVTALDKTLLLSRAEGEVYGRTWTALSAVLPQNALKKSYTGRETARYSLIIGKKTINFYKTSGISYGNYDKIMESKVLTLPGGYSFPVTWIKTTFREYTAAPVQLGEEYAQTQLTEAICAQQLLRMTAGQILHQNLTLDFQSEAAWLRGTLECQEEIGQLVEIKD